MPTDPRGLRADAPLLDAWLAFHEAAPTPMTIPGHKHRCDLVGDVVAGDVPLYAGLDTMKLTAGRLHQAQTRAAALWGVDLCRFSVGGSTHGNQALALAVGAPGDQVVISRTLHRSMFLGLVLAGLQPVWVRPRVGPTTALPTGVDAADLAVALDGSGDAAAVFVGDPSYVGTLGDVAALAEVTHARGIPLVVDAAWGPHFGFHPDLPPHALARGADAIVTSAHKTLPAISQAALILASSRRIDPARFEAAVEATATTSPSGAILASIDAARALLERDGAELLGEVIALVATARQRLRDIPGLLVLDGPGLDPTRLVLVLPGTGADGNAVESDLLAAGLPVELADRDTLVAIVTLADTADTVNRLVDVLLASLTRHHGPARCLAPPGLWEIDPVVAVSPRTAFFAEREVVPLAAAVGRVSAELLAPYPPGIPVLAPGEMVTADVLAALFEARDRGVRIAYAADPSLLRLHVLAD